jgi:uncharacterized protein (TIGR02996 family)
MPTESATNPELEAAIQRNPDDRDAYLVYGDWLQSKGDPRGQLIAVQAALLDKPGDKHLTRQERDILVEHEDALLGDLMQIEGADEEIALGWHLGFLRSATIGGDEFSEIDAIAAIRALFESPSARFLRELRILAVGTDEGQADYSEVIEALAEVELPSTLRSLTFSIESYQISWSELGDVSPLYPKVPNLRELRIKMGQMDLGRIVLPHLELFEVITGGLAREVMKSIVEAKWPELQRLTVYLGTDNYGGDCTLSDLQPLLDGRGLVRLKHLALANSEIADDIARAIASAKILPQLETLDLSKGTLGDEGAEALIAGAQALAHLKQLDLSQSYVSPAVAARLRSALPSVEVNVDDQSEPDGDYRYVQVSE